MLIFSYRLLQVIFFPIILFIGLIRIYNKKENYSLNENIVNEVKKNPVILDNLKENIYIDHGVTKLFSFNQM